MIITLEDGRMIPIQCLHAQSASHAILRLQFPLSTHTQSLRRIDRRPLLRRSSKDRDIDVLRKRTMVRDEVGWLADLRPDVGNADRGPDLERRAFTGDGGAFAIHEHRWLEARGRASPSAFADVRSLNE